MKRKCKVLRFLNSFASALCIVIATASTAFANNAPGPLAFISLISLVILIVILTFAGGGYEVAKRLDEAKYPSKVKRTSKNILEFIVGIVLFFAGLMASVFGVAGFSLYAIVRGIKMINWSRDTGKYRARPAHVQGTNPKRLRAAGIILIVLTLFVFGYSVLHLDEVTGLSDYRKKGRAGALNADVKNAYSAAKLYLKENPKAKLVTCVDMAKADYQSSFKDKITCFSDMTTSSGEIRLTGPESWGLKKPVAVMTYSGELTPAEP